MFSLYGSRKAVNYLAPTEETTARITMNFGYVLCLLFASSCCAFVPQQHVDVGAMLALQHRAMRSLVATHDNTADTELINSCFNHYMTDQTAVVSSYNTQYNGCCDSAQSSKDQLTAESAEKREQLLERSNAMCSGLADCNAYTDGQEFFECFTNASSDSYKVMFTLNSDSNTEYNYISASYDVIDSELSVCIDEARVAYAKKMDKANEDLQVCLVEGEVSTTQSSSTEPTTVSTGTTDGDVSTSTTDEGEITTDASTGTSEGGDSETTEDGTSDTTEGGETGTSGATDDNTTEDTTESSDTSTTAEEPLPEEDLKRIELFAQHGFDLNKLKRPL